MICRTDSKLTICENYQRLPNKTYFDEEIEIW